jgi:hypothetical protein
VSTVFRSGRDLSWVGTSTRLRRVLSCEQRFQRDWLIVNTTVLPALVVNATRWWVGVVRQPSLFVFAGDRERLESFNAEIAVASCDGQRGDDNHREPEFHVIYVETAIPLGNTLKSRGHNGLVVRDGRDRAGFCFLANF